ncbi:hypothetical protein [Streptomyces thermodiastaticus]|uniref:hypothetical protein n=1 Tax=Streptomyces thermodiastaticus TaxID=44061 RepID=UPI00167234E0|nr:hypothetical protein [Streptomyces thermodiastaticus]MCE7553278.1 hypothetical protein [Streptomyces thermodiastaticus]GHF94973.1 hypothetical protein GCM10018787_49700 [Streptomyces thermodiastaticus]
MPVVVDVAGGDEVVAGPSAVADEDGLVGFVEVVACGAVVEPEQVAFLDEEVGEARNVRGAVAVDVEGAVDVTDGDDLVGVGPVVVGRIVDAEFLPACGAGSGVGLFSWGGAGVAVAVVGVELQRFAAGGAGQGDEVFVAVVGPVAGRRTVGEGAGRAGAASDGSWDGAGCRLTAGRAGNGSGGSRVRRGSSLREAEHRQEGRQWRQRTEHGLQARSAGRRRFHGGAQDVITAARVTKPPKDSVP